MTRATVNRVDTDRIDDHAPPGGTAIVRPLRHVRAVRERDAAQPADPSEATAQSRSARAWAWALGEGIILRWLIGDDDHVPIEAENPGELVGGFGDVVRSPEQIAASWQSRPRASGKPRPGAGTSTSARTPGHSPGKTPATSTA